MIEHNFTGPPFTIGVEEELMILDGETHDLAQGIDTILDAVPDDLTGWVKPELMQSVLEIATTPCDDLSCAITELTNLRRCVGSLAEENGMEIGAAGTHPFAQPEDQLITDRPRYKALAEELGFIARQEIIFGTHVHVAIEGPDRAIYVADGIRRYLPMFLAISVNSPFWRGHETHMMSARTPIFRAFPRIGIPPHYGTWDIYSHRVEMMMRAGAIEDYTYMWWDVRPHPQLGTVETRIFDQPTRLEHTIAMSALTLALAHRLCRQYDEEEPLVELPTELIDDNKVRAALRGMEGELVDFRAGRRVPAPEMVHRVVDEVREDAEALGCDRELEGIEDLLANGTGARRQLDLWDGGEDLTPVTRDIVEQTKV